MFSAQVPGTGMPSEALLLDFLHHSTGARAASLAWGPSTLCTLRSLAQRSAAALDTAGVPGIALEALSVAEACVQPCSQEPIVQSVKTELAASALLQLIIGSN